MATMVSLASASAVTPTLLLSNTQVQDLPSIQQCKLHAGQEQHLLLQLEAVDQEEPQVPLVIEQQPVLEEDLVTRSLSPFQLREASSHSLSDKEDKEQLILTVTQL